MHPLHVIYWRRFFFFFLSLGTLVSWSSTSSFDTISVDGVRGFCRLFLVAPLPILILGWVTSILSVTCFFSWSRVTLILCLRHCLTMVRWGEHQLCVPVPVWYHDHLLPLCLDSLGVCSEPSPGDHLWCIPGIRRGVHVPVVGAHRFPFLHHLHPVFPLGGRITLLDLLHTTRWMPLLQWATKMHRKLH